MRIRNWNFPELFIYFISIVNAIKIAKSETDYCRISERHILCNNHKENLSSELICNGTARKLPLNKSDEIEFLSMFNRFRKKVVLQNSPLRSGNLSFAKEQPTDTMKLEWNYELQKAAEAILSKCLDEPIDPETIVFVDKETKGKIQAKNFLLKRHGEKNMDHELFLLYQKEASKYTTQKLNNKSNNKFNIFTDLTYSKARYVGCARLTHITSRQTPMISRQKMFTLEECCLVMPTEEDGSNPLNVSENLCSECLEGSSCDLDGLCAEKNKINRDRRQASNSNDQQPTTKPYLPGEGALYRLHDIYRNIDICNRIPTHLSCFNTNELMENVGNRLKCKDEYPLYLRKKDKEDLLDILNTIRSDIATGKSKMADVKNRPFPKAADMMQLEWDDELELLAETTLHNCIEVAFQYQMAFGKNMEEFVLNINMLLKDTGALTEQGDNATKSLNKNELSLDYFVIIQKEASKFTLEDLHHYTSNSSFDALTIVAFAKSRFVGCSRTSNTLFGNTTYEYGDECVFMPSEYREFAKPAMLKKSKIYVPNSTLNNLYQQGEPCSMCPFGSQCSTEYAGLCKAFLKYHGGIERPDRYCSISSQHILCSEWDFPQESNCQDKQPINSTEEVISNTLGVYNNIRRNISFGTSDLKDNLPGAADMVKLEWDYELQKAAEKILHNCTTRDIGSGSLKFGKNGEMQANQIVVVYDGDNFEDALKDALKEQAKNFDLANINNYKADVGYKMFTTLAMSDTRFIGCAQLKPPSLPDGKISETMQLCLVAAPEEVENNQLYNNGESCTKCKRNFYCEDGLCKGTRVGIERPDRYCSLKSKHILCQDWDPKQEIGNNENCKDQKHLTMTKKESNEIRDNYNLFRSEIAKGKSSVNEKLPEAADMVELEWDKELQNAAKSILYSCIPQDKVSPELLKFGRHGELQAKAIFLNHDGTNYKEKLMKELGDEAKLFDISKLENYTADEKFQSFSSSAFSTARYLGCARASSVNDSILSNITEVCVIGATENITDNLLYKSGKACSKCQIGFKCNPKLGLCKGPLPIDTPPATSPTTQARADPPTSRSTTETTTSTPVTVEVTTAHLTTTTPTTTTTTTTTEEVQEQIELQQQVEDQPQFDVGDSDYGQEVEPAADLPAVKLTTTVRGMSDSLTSGSFPAKALFRYTFFFVALLFCLDFTQ